VNLALSAFSLFTVDLALWSLAHRVAYSRAYGIIALPSAFWMAIALDFGFERDYGGESQRSQ